MRILVTAGPTREHLDPVRFLSNRSSGKMGYAVAERALARGHKVTLISGPVTLEPPEGARLVRVRSALDMLAAVEENLPLSEALVMSAAVADWRPREYAADKLKKRHMRASLELVPNPDILMTMLPGKNDGIWVGFAAETADIMSEARSKLERKGLDMIVANDVSQADAGFEVDTNRVVLVTRDEPPRFLPLMSKVAVAEKIIEWLEKRRESPRG